MDVYSLVYIIMIIIITIINSCFNFQFHHYHSTSSKEFIVHKFLCGLK